MSSPSYAAKSHGSTHYLLFLISILSLSLAPILVRWSQGAIETIGFWRLLMASLVMYLLSKRNNERETLSHSTWIFVTLSGIFLFLHLWTFFYAAQNTKIANAVILFSCNPIFTAIISNWTLKEKFHPKLIVTYLLGFSGIIVLFHENIEISSPYQLGNLSAILSAILYSGYILFGKKARIHMRNSTFTYSVYGMAAFGFLLSALLRNQSLMNDSPQFWIAIIGMVIFPTLLGHALFSYLIKFININWLSSGKLLEPPLSALMAVFIFQETLTGSMILAFLLTAASVISLIW